jgi:hypothetical protein
MKAIKLTFYNVKSFLGNKTSGLCRGILTIIGTIKI